jgi:predicted GNAT family acetyltransferase
MDGRRNNAISIEKRVAGTSGRYVGRIDGVDGEAELIFTVRGPSLISADHTEAPASMRGTGAAMALVEHLIGDARAREFKIIPIVPTCSPSTGSIPSGATSS